MSIGKNHLICGLLAVILLTTGGGRSRRTGVTPDHFGRRAFLGYRRE